MPCKPNGISNAVSKNLSVRQTEELVAQILNPEGGDRKKEKAARVLDPNVRDAARSLDAHV